MNIDKLNDIAEIVLEDYRAKNVPKLIVNLVSHLEQMISNPAQENHAQAFNKVRTQISQALTEAKSNNFNIVDLQAAKELNVDKVIGKTLLARIEEKISGNDIEKQAAVGSIKEISAEVAKANQAMTKIREGFGELGLQELSSRESFELVVRIPRPLFSNNVFEFSEHLAKLNECLLVFTEVSTGTREPLVLKSLSTSDPLVALEMVKENGVLILNVLASIASIYSVVITHKKNKKSFVEDGAPEELFDGLSDWIGRQVKERIYNEIPEIVEKSYNKDDEHRLRELQIDAKRKALRLAELMDDGYTIDVRVPDTLVENSEEVGEAVNDAIAQLRTNSLRIESSNDHESKLLKLPESDEELDSIGD